jgi:hypothetical protein
MLCKTGSNWFIGRLDRLKYIVHLISAQTSQKGTKDRVTKLLKFIYSEKATKFCKISTLLLTGTKGKIIYKAIEVSCLINLHFPSNLNFSFRGMLLNVALSFIIQPSSTTDKSVLFSDSGQALPSVFT